MELQAKKDQSVLPELKEIPELPGLSGIAVHKDKLASLARLESRAPREKPEIKALQVPVGPRETKDPLAQAVRPDRQAAPGQQARQDHRGPKVLRVPAVTLA